MIVVPGRGTTVASDATDHEIDASSRDLFKNDVRFSRMGGDET